MGRYRFEEKHGEKHLIKETWLGKIDFGKLEKDLWDPFLYHIHGPVGLYWKLEDKSGGREEEFEIERRLSLFSISKKGILKRVNGCEYEYISYSFREKNEYGVYPLSEKWEGLGATGGGLISLLIFLLFLCLLIASAMVGVLLYLFLYPLREKREKFLDFVISTAPGILSYIVLVAISFMVNPLVGYFIVSPLMVLLAPLGFSIIYLLLSTVFPSSLLETWGFFPLDQSRIIFTGAGILILVAWIVGIGKKKKIIHISTYLLTGGFVNFAILVEGLSKLSVSLFEFPYVIALFSPIFQLFTFFCWILGIFALLSLILPLLKLNKKFNV
jgi:hypothetical protein